MERVFRERKDTSKRNEKGEEEKSWVRESDRGRDKEERHKEEE